MIYTSQVILTTNSEIYIPSSSVIRASGQEYFKRGNSGRTTTLPALVYSFLPVNPDSSDTQQPHERVVSSQSWNPHSGDLLNVESLVLVRVFLVPHSDTGSVFCSYAIPTSNMYTTTQYNDVEFNSKRHYFFVETLRNTHHNLPHPPPSTTVRAPNAQNLGPAVRQNQQHRVIN